MCEFRDRHAQLRNRGLGDLHWLRFPRLHETERIGPGRLVQSTDNFDAQANIRYDVYVNDRFEDVVFGSGGPRVIYGDVGPNLIEVFATDTAGNRSAAGTVTIFL